LTTEAAAAAAAAAAASVADLIQSLHLGIKT
jgi:hypothetical protein